MPLPFDLASVAWLAHHKFDMWWPRADALHMRAQAIRADTRASDQAHVIRDQTAYIKSLEAQLAPHLVRPLGEQGTLG